jgi:PadR family transcriptional regulator, regulatory protein PadR
VRRKSGTLLPLEFALCHAAAELAERGVGQFHGYELAKALADIAEHRLLTAYGTLYRALARLEKMGLLESSWEDPLAAAGEKRPRRRLYALTGAGMEAVCEARKAAIDKARRPANRRLAPA